MIFLSHANEPTDNEFTRWLALRRTVDTDLFNPLDTRS